MAHKLLLADDSVTIQRVIELTFADEDVQVVAVGDGKKAIASIQADRPDIVLADVGMPERDGYEVAAFIKGNPQFSSIPVLLLTGAFEPIDETRARAVGCDGVLVKPFEPQMVINRVKDLLAGRRPAGLWSANPAAQSPTRQPPAAYPAKEVTLQAAVPRDAQVATGGSLEDYFDRLDAAFATVEGAAESQAALAQPPRSPEPPAPAARAVPATPFSPVDLGDWDPDLAGDPEKPAAVAPPSLPPPPPVPVTMAAAPPSPPVAVAPPAPPVAAPASARRTATISQAPPARPAEVSPTPYSPPAPSPAHAQSTGSVQARQEPATPVPPAFVPPAPPMPSLAEAFAALLSAEQSRSIAPSTIGASAVSDDTVDDIVRRVIARMGDQAFRDTVVDVAERLVREEIERIKGS
jgi:CheY-like chemotaxis protein